MKTVLAQECIRYNKLVDVMELTLPQLDKALQGLVVMSGELESMGCLPRGIDVAVMQACLSMPQVVPDIPVTMWRKKIFIVYTCAKR